MSRILAHLVTWGGFLSFIYFGILYFVETNEFIFYGIDIILDLEGVAPVVISAVLFIIGLYSLSKFPKR